MDAVDNKYIEEAISVLVNTVGLQEPADSQTLLALIESGKIKEAITVIARYLGLPIEITLAYVSDEYNSDSTDRFESKHLVRTNSHGRGADSITAQILIPGHLPFFGSAGMVNFPINVRVRKNCVDHAMTFAGLIAHELCHIVLHSMRHKQKENEFYTDLTAMMLGFAEIMKLGRKIVTSSQQRNTITTRTVTYGYLSDSNFTFAIGKIQHLLDGARDKKSNALEKIEGIEKDLHQRSIMVRYFREYLAYLDRKPIRRISQDDSQWIALFHQPDYDAKLITAIRKTDEQLRQFRTYVQHSSHYDDIRFDTIRKY
jgi:hypothetical protein